MLINELQSELQNARIAGRQNTAHRGRADVADWIGEVRVIQGVKKLGAELKIHALAQVEAAEDRAVQIVAARPNHGVAAEVAELPQRRRPERGGVEILLDKLTAGTAGIEQ